MVLKKKSRVPLKVAEKKKPEVEVKNNSEQDFFLATHKMRWELRDWMNANSVSFLHLNEKTGISELKLRNIVYRGDQRISPDECIKISQVTGIESFSDSKRLKLFNELQRMLSELPTVMVEKIKKSQWKRLINLAVKLGISIREVGERADIKPPNRIYNFYVQDKPEVAAKRRFLETLKEVVCEI